MGANPCSSCKYYTKIVSALATLFQCTISNVGGGKRKYSVLLFQVTRFT